MMQRKGLRLGKMSERRIMLFHVVGCVVVMMM